MIDPLPTPAAFHSISNATVHVRHIIMGYFRLFISGFFLLLMLGAGMVQAQMAHEPLTPHARMYRKEAPACTTRTVKPAATLRATKKTVPPTKPDPKAPCACTNKGELTPLAPAIKRPAQS